jgi:hypothetical protein
MHLEVYVEEPSAEAALGILIPKIVGEAHSHRIYNLMGKDTLLRELPKRLRSYRGMSMQAMRIVALVDRDRDDCADLKQGLEAMAAAAKIPTRAARKPGQPAIMDTRLAIEELEAWYIGDVPALRSAYPKVPATLDKWARFRFPDAVAGGTWETLERALQRYGYHSGGLAKIKLARDVAAHMNPAANRSESFCRFRDALVELMQ